MPKLKLPPDDLDKIIEALNVTKTVTDAADMLNVTRQALRLYMNANGIERICEYRQTSKSITAIRSKE